MNLARIKQFTVDWWALGGFVVSVLLATLALYGASQLPEGPADGRYLIAGMFFGWATAFWAVVIMSIRKKRNG